ncbi:Gamma-D-glutamyl-L-lysine endopeptidase [Arthrobacter saudimassiliensis]|uniref:Gamma-D-glutamyl-L-lysine endopeptidase n=1 Tax=Arthrobacter saudimassiliensis TaxID=1461584 RepID=A0A078MK14_9MICC|nr:Gamma-D-glutamyl-L-lysine endopeptidase [Arthrobacter saudimassiliensis]
MSMPEALGRIQEIRSTLDQLTSTAPATQAAPSTSSASAASSAEFAAALGALSGSTPAAGASAVGGSAAGGAAPGQVLDAVQKYLGLPYIWGGNDPSVGLDCSSFVQNVFKDLGYSLPRVTWDQMNVGTKVDSMAQAQPGDLLFSHDGGHVAIYLGGGKAVDAPQPGQTIQIRDAWENDGNLTTIRRVLPAADTAAGAPAVTDLVASARMAQAALLGAGA